MTPISPIRLSMWSGPRNISTALMRSFGNRNDCQAIDEPFYAYYLNETGLAHPMREEVIQSQPNDWETVAEALNGPVEGNKSLLYIKHMAQHMLPPINKDCFLEHVNCFLIRDPRLVIASFAQKWDQIEASTTGFPQQMELFEYFSEHGKYSPVVIEGEDILKAPETMLSHLCTTIGIDFDPSMLAWEKGPRKEDGVWGSHWYSAVENSTGFQTYEKKSVILTREQEQLAGELQPIYELLRKKKLVPSST